ncbi:hypothetical protein [Acinetobacter sp.]|uniref:hypothetical protein n=1 Tax=Acinetobacter sp. TaxID=472 RepID=UPI00388DC098
MIDKNEQRRRAEEITRALAAQGLKAPVLPMPVITKKSLAAPSPKSSSGCKFDCAGQMLNVGDKVATTLGGYVSSLIVGTVTGFGPKKVFVDVPSKPNSLQARNGVDTQNVSKFPEQLAKLA